MDVWIKIMVYTGLSSLSKVVLERDNFEFVLLNEHVVGKCDSLKPIPSYILEMMKKVL